MTDVVDPATRSRMMSGIRGKNTKRERIVRSLLHRIGYRSRIHRKDLPGNPDIVLPKYRAVIFVHGCYWHGHGCYRFKVPQTNTEFWIGKIRRNMERDRRQCRELKEKGWRIATVWECALDGRKRMEPQELAQRLSAWIRSGSSRITIGSDTDEEGIPV